MLTALSKRENALWRSQSIGKFFVEVVGINVWPCFWEHKVWSHQVKRRICRMESIRVAVSKLLPSLIRTRGLHMPWLFALIANTLRARLLGTVAAQVAYFTTYSRLHPSVTWQVSQIP